MSRVALYGGMGDYSDETPFMRRMYSMWDKRLIYFEGGILTQALEGSRKEYDYKRKLINILARNELPSNYEWIWSRAGYNTPVLGLYKDRVSSSIDFIIPYRCSGPLSFNT